MVSIPTGNMEEKVLKGVPIFLDFPLYPSDSSQPTKIQVLHVCMTNHNAGLVIL